MALGNVKNRNLDVGKSLSGRFQVMGETFQRAEWLLETSKIVIWTLESPYQDVSKSSFRCCVEQSHWFFI